MLDNKWYEQPEISPYFCPATQKIFSIFTFNIFPQAFYTHAHTHTRTLAFVKCKQKCLVWCLFCLCDFTYRFRLCLSPLHAHTPADKEWERGRRVGKSGGERERDEDNTQREKYHNYMPRHRIPKQMRNLPAPPALTKHFARFCTIRLYMLYICIYRESYEI